MNAAPRNHLLLRPGPLCSISNAAKVGRATDLHRARSISLRKDFRECEEREHHRVEERVHRHRDKDGTAPFIGNSQTTTEGKERREGREVRVGGGEKQRIERQCQKPTAILLEHAVEKKTKKKLLSDWRQHDREKNNQD